MILLACQRWLIEYNPRSMLTVHFDRKTYYKRGNTHNKRLAIAVSYSDGKAKLLGVPEMENSTELADSRGVFDMLNRWGHKEKVQSMSCDGEPKNTGRKNGACPLLEEALGKQLLWLMFRHHILEIILGAVFADCLEEKKNVKSGKIVLCEHFCRIYHEENLKTKTIRGCRDDPIFQRFFTAPEMDNLVELRKSNHRKKEGRYRNHHHQLRQSQLRHPQH